MTGKKWQKVTRTQTKAQAMDIVEKNKSIKLQQRIQYTPKKDFKQQKQQEKEVMH